MYTATATLRNVTIHCDRMGSGEPLVLIHGLGERKEGWACQYTLANSYDLIIPDLPGHGQSAPAEKVSIEAFARHVLELLDVLEVESAHICGLSMGGVVAQEMYRMAPDRCRSLILVNTFFYVPRLMRAPLYQLWTWRANFLPPQWRMSLAAATCLVNWKSETLERFQHAMEHNASTYRQTLEACLQVDNTELLPRIKVPTLILASDYDLLTPLWGQMMIHHLIPGSKMAILHCAGHMAKLEQPEEFNRKILEFLSELKIEKSTANQDIKKRPE
ncbi:alpha/beta hydrolase [Alicyclobacillus pomorum]|jgi:3-oxoadipate enol-lactonase|uniref:alpha/beta fold hydrolase n=1 Tax=Alicyclobacillus pomorum TaxID=204470 RepID=UPI000405080F|nr:alpha/beta hydrolase [Alicyclobacillus pomorum]